LIIGDGLGITTLNAASIYENVKTEALYVYHMPHFALADTSTVDNWVTDGAGGTTPVATGVKTKKGVISQSPDAIWKFKDGKPLKTILEYAEERGLSTGLVTNSGFEDAFPAAFYAHRNSMNQVGGILFDLLHSRFGDGVDVVIGADRIPALRAAKESGFDLAVALRRRGYEFLSTVDELRERKPLPQRVVVATETTDFDVTPAAHSALEILGRNPKGFFLMIHSDCHLKDVERSLRRTIELDNLIRQIVENHPSTLVLVTADHSYGLRLKGGGFGGGVLQSILFNGEHTAEEVPVFGAGPGSEGLHGFISNARVFDVMMQALGWTQKETASRKIQALIVTGQDAHPWRETTPYLRDLLDATGKFEVRVTEEFRGSTRKSLAPYDVVILNYSDEKLAIPTWSSGTKEALLAFVRSGKGLVVYHHSAASFQDWPEFEKLVGCVWRTGQSHHSPVHDYRVDIRDTGHPITSGLTSFMARTDELYAGLLCQPPANYHVLATAWDDHSLYRGRDNSLAATPSLDQPLLWTVPYGAGRVFATMLGNDMRAVTTPGFTATFVRGAEWAATGTVTIPVPAELSKPAGSGLSLR
jgi:type 1 glutamine amidotransferase